MTVKKAEDPFVFTYIQTKAKTYLEMGPDKYREEDFFHMPDKDWSKSDLKNIENCFQKFLEGKGLRKDNPVKGVGISGFSNAMATLHFGMVSQKASKIKEGILDEMVYRHLVRPEMEVTLYNIVNY